MHPFPAAFSVVSLNRLCHEFYDSMSGWEQLSDIREGTVVIPPCSGIYIYGVRRAGIIETCYVGYGTNLPKRIVAIHYNFSLAARRLMKGRESFVKWKSCLNFISIEICFINSTLYSTNWNSRYSGWLASKPDFWPDFWLKLRQQERLA